MRKSGGLQTRQGFVILCISLCPWAFFPFPFYSNHFLEPNPMKLLICFLVSISCIACDQFNKSKKKQNSAPEETVEEVAPEPIIEPIEEEAPVQFNSEEKEVFQPYIWKISKEGSEHTSYLFASHNYNLRIDELPQDLLDKIGSSQMFYSDRIEMNLINKMRTSLATMKDIRLKQQFALNPDEFAALDEILNDPELGEPSNTDDFLYHPIYFACRDLIRRATLKYSGDLTGLLEDYAKQNGLETKRLDPDLGFNLRILRRSCSEPQLKSMISDFSGFESRVDSWFRGYFEGNLISLLDERDFYREILNPGDLDSFDAYSSTTVNKWFKDLEQPLRENSIFISIDSRTLLQDMNLIDFLEQRGFVVEKI